MKTEKSRSGSALRKLIPATAMLMTSAVMLSSATYAWFTMNKEVQMTGLNMSATASEGIEIALASIKNKAISFDYGTGNTHPADDDDNEKGWKSQVAVGTYYSDIGKLRPASSVNGTDLFYATDASSNGKEASTFTAVTTESAQVKKNTSTDEAVTTITSESEAGYYLDIPVHIRTSKQQYTPSSGGETVKEEELYCRLIINNNLLEGATDDEKTKNSLYKAVRVAFIPTTTGTQSTTKIFGCDDKYYKDVEATHYAVSSTSSRDVVKVETNSVSSSTSFTPDEGVQSGLSLPLGVDGGYGHLDFTLRVWLEGESTSCFDEKAGQNWNMSFAFSLGKFDTGTSATNETTVTTE